MRQTVAGRMSLMYRLIEFLIEMKDVPQRRDCYMVQFSGDCWQYRQPWISGLPKVVADGRTFRAVFPFLGINRRDALLQAMRLELK